MKCPKCKSEDHCGTIDSRPIADYHRRRRVCPNCGYRFFTQERYVPDDGEMPRFDKPEWGTIRRERYKNETN